MMLAARKVAGCRPKRAAFTLVEMLIALAILLVLSTLLIGFGSRMMESRRSNSGADLLQKWLLIAKQRALRDQTPTGIRLVGDTAAGTLVTQLMYVQQPPDLHLGNPISILNSLGTTSPPPPPFDHVHLIGASGGNDFIGPFGAGLFQNVMPGDFLQQPAGAGQLHAVLAPVKPTAITILGLGAPSNPIPLPGTTDYVFVRGPRPLQGEDPLPLPQDVAIDTVTNVTYGNTRPINPNSLNTEIIFGPDGRVIGQGTSTGKIILWVRDVTQANAEQSLIVIYTRTGFIASHPVNTLPGTPPYTDPYSFTRDGRTSGS
jgi:prepilin-type N-terminal cleavage/methylation domain-containing protein